jgi:hypothetical protein
VKKKDLTPEVIRRATERSARASMALEGRVVPEGYVRSEGVQRLLDERRRRIAAEDRESNEPFDGHTPDDSIR